MKQDNQIEADYFGLASAWDEELYGKLKTDRRIAWIVAGVSAAIAMLSVIALMMITPLKTVEPYVIMVDKTTGYSEAQRKLVYNETNPLTELESVVLAEINQYIISRETFDPTDLNTRFLRVQLSTDASEFTRYTRIVEKEVNQFGPEVRRFVSIKSIVPNLNTKSATIRFSTETINLTRSTTQHWVATLTYDFLDLPLQMKHRYLNPLGVIIQSYRVDRENVN